MLRSFVLLMGIALTKPAYAHLGHMGELAGHAHWVGLGAVVVAGVLTGAIGKLTEKDSEDKLEEETEPGEEALVEG